MFYGPNLSVAQELVACIRSFHAKGWSPATSTNYSFRSQKSEEIVISRSGVDKELFKIEDLILINSTGEILPPFNLQDGKSSAETLIHTSLYRLLPKINCVFHTHSVLGTVLSHSLVQENKLIFEGLEILKGLEGNKTHELREIIPIVPNSQDMKEIIQSIENKVHEIHGFLIAGHGLYTWGTSLAAAKRHVETFEFLFECYSAMRRL
jgi:methylthioribulose-1-phosphate dehydratase